MNKKIPLWKRHVMQLNMQKSDPLETINPKEKFRIICEDCIPYIRNIVLPSITQNNKYEAVLIEYRCFPHLEFLIRNTIIKLGEKWSHTIICGTNNYDYMVSMCSNISTEIKIIKTEYDNLNQSTYSVLLASKAFWELFTGEKILLYQEDSCIFKSNIDDFLEWDYIGAPWPKIQNDTPNCVGNGGFSLRTKQCMIDVIEHISIENTELSRYTAEYVKNTKMSICPEDVYFSKNMQIYNLGKVADWDDASEFSSELIYNENSFGGHNFWLNDGNWMNRVFSLYNYVPNNKIIGFDYISYLNNNHDCVCIASPYEYTVGGGEKYLSFLIKYFMQKKYKIIFFTISDIATTLNTLQYYNNDRDISNIYISNYNLTYNGKMSNIYFKYFVFMYNTGIIYKNIQISAATKIFHCQFPFDYELPKLKMDEHYIHDTLNSYQHIIVNSEYTKNALIEHYKTYNYFTENIHVVYPPCIEYKADEMFEKKENTFIMLGRIFDYNFAANNKYFDIAISVFNELCNYDYKLIIIGSVKSNEYYERLINMINDKNKIMIFPDISDEEKNKYLQESKYYIQLTGINDKYAFNKEHFGISMVEAVNYGCIPISCNAGYPKYLIENNVNGHLVDNQESLKELIVNILENRAPEIIKTIDIDKFTEDAFFKKLDNIFINCKHICSLGTLCHSSQLLKNNNLKKCSYPFDWIFSNTDMIMHCIEDDFKIFLDKSYYVDTPDNKCSHTYYQITINSSNPIFNHHNPMNENDYNYFVRCVDRFKLLIKNEEFKIFCISFINMDELDENIKKNIIDFNNKFSNYAQKYKLLVILNIKNKENNYHMFTNSDNIDFLELHTISSSNGKEFINDIDNQYLNKIIKKYITPFLI